MLDVSKTSGVLSSPEFKLFVALSTKKNSKGVLVSNKSLGH